MPEVIDPDGDGYQVEIENLFSGGLYGFCTFSQAKLSVSPTLESQVAQYNIIIKLTDNNVNGAKI